MNENTILPKEETGKNVALMLSQMIFHQATRAHGVKLRGVGITRKDKTGTKSARKAASKQRAVNRKRASKKSRPTGSKQRK